MTAGPNRKCAAFYNASRKRDPSERRTAPRDRRPAMPAFVGLQPDLEKRRRNRTMILTLDQLCRRGLLRRKRVFIRSDLNVPQDDSGAITEDTRIRASLPAIRMALDAGAAVMVTSHLGRPTEGETRPGESLAPVAQRLSELLGI